MKKYEITFTEQFKRVIEVEGEDKEEAMELAEDQYETEFDPQEDWGITDVVEIT
jgi:hypothetical protein